MSPELLMEYIVAIPVGIILADWISLVLIGLFLPTDIIEDIAIRLGKRWRAKLQSDPRRRKP